MYCQITGFFTINQANLTTVPFPIPLKMRIFITKIFINNVLEILIFVGRGPQKTNTQKSFFSHKCLNKERVQSNNTLLEAHFYYLFPVQNFFSQISFFGVFDPKT